MTIVKKIPGFTERKKPPIVDEWRLMIQEQTWNSSGLIIPDPAVKATTIQMNVCSSEKLAFWVGFDLPNARDKVWIAGAPHCSNKGVRAGWISLLPVEDC